MTAVLADTHAVFWLLFDAGRLSAAARTALEAAARADTLYISTITLVEVCYLQGKRSVPYPNALAQLHQALGDPAFGMHSLNVTVGVARALERVPRDEVPDMPDRVIAATAAAYGLPLVSADAAVRASAGLAVLTRVVW